MLARPPARAQYHAELDKMRELKTQHMALFISKTREKIAVLWDQLFLSASERSHSFPAFFQTEGTCTDELLAAHELEIEHLMNQIKIKAPVLKLVGRYRDLCEEGRSLDESAADSARLLGRGNRGDPGRLLREEKMRKRVKVQKPRVSKGVALPCFIVAFVER